MKTLGSLGVVAGGFLLAVQALSAMQGRTSPVHLIAGLILLVGGITVLAVTRQRA